MKTSALITRIIHNIEKLINDIRKLISACKKPVEKKYIIYIYEYEKCIQLESYIKGFV